MAHSFSYLLFKLNFLQPSKATILDWKNVNAIDKLEYALQHGNYKTRQWAAEALEHVGTSSSVPILLDAIHDKIQNVSIAALNALENIACTNELIILITRKRFNWVNKIRKREERQNNKIPKNYNVRRRERSSKKTFEMAKERLKRPIR